MTKSRSQTLQNQVRILKEQMVALEEKGRHDDELVDALTARLKSKGDKFFENGDRPWDLYFDVIEREERQQRMIFGFKNYGFSVRAFFIYL